MEKKVTILSEILCCSWSVLESLPEPSWRGFWTPKLSSGEVLGRSWEVLGRESERRREKQREREGEKGERKRESEGLGGRPVCGWQWRGSPRVPQRSKGSLGGMASPRSLSSCVGGSPLFCLVFGVVGCSVFGAVGCVVVTVLEHS